MKYELGQELKDIVTGFKGIVTGRAQYLTGCTHYGIQPKSKDGVSVASVEWFDESRLIPTGKRLEEYRSPRTSGPVENPPNM